MLGHELTAMHGSDHAQTLAVVLPALWNENVTLNAPNCSSTPNAWNITDGSDDARIDAAIEATRHFFESPACQRVSGYGSTAAPSPPCWRNWKHTV